jgi:cell division protein FtsB
MVAGGASCWCVVALARRQAEQTSRERARLEAEIEKMRQALEEERRRQRLEYDPPDNVVNFWRG